MRNYALLAKFLLCGILGGQWFLPWVATGQIVTDTAPTCVEVQMFSSHWLSEIPAPVQAMLRTAVRSKLQAIIKDPGSGMGDTVLEGIPLNAVEVARTSGLNALYVVDWDDPSFGVNGFNWIVEVTQNGPVNLLSDRASTLAGGFGVQVLGHEDLKYPEIMIASKGYAEGGGAEGEAGCFQKAGPLYDAVACPVGCFEQLNSR